MKNLIAVTIGDIQGIGIHILIKEWKKQNINNYILITNYNLLKNLKIVAESKLNVIESEEKIYKYNKNKINILDIKTKNIYTNALDSLDIAYELTKKKIFIGVLTLPINKKEINKFVNKKFIDQTTYYSKKEKNINSSMVFIYKNKFFIPLTIHIELKNVYKHFKKKDLMINNILAIKKTLSTDFKIDNPSFVIAGINPHAGENGLISSDEKKYLLPIIKELKKKQLKIEGPFSGDGLINDINLKKYDVFLFPYHDQALIPFKIISKYEGVNFTSNLKIIRLSPSHGTARNLIGTKNINSKGIINSFRTIKNIYKNKIINSK